MMLGTTNIKNRNICPETWTENSKDVYRSSICVYQIRGRQKKYKSTDKSPEDNRSLQQRHVTNKQVRFKNVSIYTTRFFALTSLSLNIGPNMTKQVKLLTHMGIT